MAKMSDLRRLSLALERDRKKRPFTKPEIRMCQSDNPQVNMLLNYAIVLYRTTILALDIVVFLLKSVGEYIRLAFRTFIPRPLRSVVGEVVLVTGAGHGIGREIAKQMGALGAIIICVDVNEKTNSATAEQVKKDGGVAWAFQCDVSNREAVSDLRKKVREVAGDVTVLINNAGVMIAQPFLSQPVEDIERTVNVNLMGQMWCLREFLPSMLERRRGSLVFMCGLPGHAGAPNMVPYSASKFAIRGMMEAIYIELRQNHPDNNIHIMLVSPFIVETGMVKRHKIRFRTMGVVDPPTAADRIITSLRRRAAVVFIPEMFYYVTSLVRILPAKVQLLLTDFIDTGIEPHEDYND